MCWWMMYPKEAEWRQFEKSIQTIFSRNKAARLFRDAEITGQSGRTRKVELLVHYPFEIEFHAGFKAVIPIKIAVDCKNHAKKIEINLVDQFIGQMDDIGAHVGIMVATSGFGEGAEARAKTKNIFLVNATWDLMLLARGLRVPEYECRACLEALGPNANTSYGQVCWDQPTPFLEAVFKVVPELKETPRTLRGECGKCGTKHVFCPDCGHVTGFLEADEVECIKCSGDCGRIYVVSTNHPLAIAGVISLNDLERQIIKRAARNRGRIRCSEVHELVKSSKWQHYFSEHGVAWFLQEAGWLGASDGDDGTLMLTEDASSFVRDYLKQARHSYYDA